MKNPLKKTHVAFKCNLDSPTVSKYLSIMEYVNLVEKSKEHPSYFTITQKGIKFVKRYGQLISMMGNDSNESHVKYSDINEILANLKIQKSSYV